MSEKKKKKKFLGSPVMDEERARPVGDFLWSGSEF